MKDGINRLLAILYNILVVTFYYDRHMKKLLIAVGIEFLLLCVLYNYLLTVFFPEEKSLVAVGIISFVMMIPVVMVNGIYGNTKELSLLRGSHNPKVKDGQRVALTGYVRSPQEPLLSPFTKKPCVSYSYSVSRTVSRGKSSSKHTEYSGNVQVPSTLRTNTMDVRLLGLMEGEEESFDESDQEEKEIFQNAYEYVRSRQFQPKKSVSEAWSKAKEMMTDNDGSMLEEVKVTDDPLDLSDRTLEEWCLEINKPYSIIGVWSSAQNGLISDPFGKGTITVLKGDAAEAIKTMRGKIGCLITVTIFLIVLLNFLAYAALKN